MKYWIERWSQLRQKELIAYPNEFPIHDAYMMACTQEELKSGFGEMCFGDFLSARRQNYLEMRVL